MPTPPPQSNPAEQLENLLRDVTACLEAPEGGELVACQKHLLRVIDILQTTRQRGIAIPPSIHTTMRHINALRRQAETILTQTPSGVAPIPLAYRRDGSAELTTGGAGGFEMEL